MACWIGALAVLVGGWVFAQWIHARPTWPNEQQRMRW